MACGESGGRWRKDEANLGQCVEFTSELFHYFYHDRKGHQIFSNVAVISKGFRREQVVEENREESAKAATNM